MNPETVDAFYPIITDNLSDFVDDYSTRSEYLDAKFVMKNGDKIFEASYIDNIEDLATEWIDECNTILIASIDPLARMYYAITSDFNPLWNVDGTEKTEYSETHREEKYPDVVTESTNAQRTITSTDYSMTYDSNTEKESGKNETLTPSGTDSVKEKEHTNEYDEDEHSVTVTRQGNIGVTKSTELVADSMKMYQKYNFFNMLFDKIIVETGVYYD